VSNLLDASANTEADVNIEFQSTARFADEAMEMAFFFRDANEKYATDYPDAVGNHITNTDSTPFMDFTPSISLRENERGMHIGAGWDPHWHQPTDRLRHVLRQRLSTWLECRTDDVGGCGAAGGRQPEAMSLAANKIEG
jgi:hypothetical protein